jgi:hypothetical protein
MTPTAWKYSRGNNATGFTDINGVDYYFSYKTLIAFKHSSCGLVIRQNDWSTTTGTHLNDIARDKSKRVSGVEFENKLSELKAALKNGTGDERIFYSLNVSDIQHVARQELDRNLTPEELETVEREAADTDSWYGDIAAVINNHPEIN